MTNSKASLLAETGNADAGADGSRGETHRASPTAVSVEHAQLVTELYDRYRRSLLSYLLGLLRRRADAEDVLQEAYARLLTADRFDWHGGRSRAYLFKIATNLAYDRFRGRKEQSIEDARPEQESPSLDDTPDAIVDFEQGLEIVKKTLLELKPRCRQVFLLRSSEELSYEAIAERIGVSKRTVEREMQHALEVLQTRLKRSRR